MPLYRAGTVSLTLGSRAVVGVGTEFGSKASPGDILVLDGSALGTYCYEILSIESDTELTLDVDALETVSGAGYVIIRSVSTANNLYLMRKIDEFLKDRQRTLLEMVDWLSGTPGGGPDADGKYPLTDRYGVTTKVLAPAALEANLQENIDQVDQLVTDLGGLAQAVSDAEAAESAAQAAQQAAEDARDTAQGHEVAALASEQAAAASESNASDSEAAALASQNAAASSASNAASSASAALASRNEADGFAQDAQDWAQLAQTTFEAKADKATTVTAGDGLTGGGSLAQNRTITMGTPGTLSGDSTNEVTSDSHTHEIAAASETVAGVVKLADNASTLAGEDDATAVTPAGLEYAALKKLPTVPTSDRGPIYVPGIGIMEWDGGISAYVAKAGGATGGGANQVFYENDKVVTDDYTITPGRNAVTAGPIEIAAGVTVTVPPGSTWSIV